ncbi:hypothetical protein FQN54_000376 [Arachnomyces sp. PD_36]|nr:hypothetical protein FQN54_000376 [Arachnomyces sp. PD_36]
MQLFNPGCLLKACSSLSVPILGLIAALTTGASAEPLSAQADLSSKQFELTEPSYDLFRHVSLHDVTVQQSFAFDNVNRRLFVAQRLDGSDTADGHLCITQLDFDGNYVGYMHLEGFGHGVSFAAEAVDSSTYLWTEIDPSSSGYGTKLTRFEFVSETTLSNEDSDLTRIDPIPDASLITCSMDPVSNNLVLRYKMDDGQHIAVFPLESAKEGNFSSPLADFLIPDVDVLAERFQGYAAYGQYIYLLTGDSYDITGGEVNSEITTVDMNTGEVVEGPVLTKAGSTLSFREAEGMAIYETADGEVRLFLGFASGVDSGDRRSNLFFKNSLV